MSDQPPPPGSPYPHSPDESWSPPEESPPEESPPEESSPPPQPPPPQPPPRQPPPPQPPQQPPPPPPTSGSPVGPVPPRRTGALIATAVVVGILAVAIAVLATVLLVDDDETTTSTTIDGTLPTTTAPASTTPDGSGGTGGGTTGGGGVPAAALQEVERILGQSAVGRAEIIDVVNGVMTCAIPLDEASARLDAVSSNRQAVLAQVDALGPSGNATLDRAIDLFGQSIVSSLEANAGYLAWFDWLGSTQGAFYSGGCLPSGTAPTNADYDDATAASARATAAKAEFVSLFNPIAQAAGLRTWSDTEI